MNEMIGMSGTNGTNGVNGNKPDFCVVASSFLIWFQHQFIARWQSCFTSEALRNHLYFLNQFKDSDLKKKKTMKLKAFCAQKFLWASLLYHLCFWWRPRGSSNTTSKRMMQWRLWLRGLLLRFAPDFNRLRSWMMSQQTFVISSIQ